MTLIAPAKQRTKTAPPARENICAVVVTYFPDACFPDRLQQICHQVDHAVVIDNGSDTDAYRHVQAAVMNCRAALIRNATNLGVATALNQGIRCAQEKGYTWALLLDQDTTPWPTTLQKLTQAYGEFPCTDRLAILGCNRFLKSPAPGRKWWTSAKEVITSGTLLSLEAARVIGPFREEFFIDCVDFDFCLRARFMGFKIVEILEPIMTHSIGNPKPIRLLWLKGRTSNHRPWRWYYMVRNNVVLVREYFWRDPMWALLATLSCIQGFALALLFDKARLLKVKYAMLGFCDGLAGRFDRAIN